METWSRQLMKVPPSDVLHRTLANVFCRSHTNMRSLPQDDNKGFGLRIRRHAWPGTTHARRILGKLHERCSS